MRPTRREALAGGLAAAAAVQACAQTRDAAPTPTDPAPWIAYEALLRARLADAGGGRSDAAMAKAVLALTNEARVAAGAGPLAWHEELALTARAHAADLAHRHYLEHVTAEGFDPSHRFWLLARRTIGSPSENIAYHQSAPASAGRLMEIWRRSPRHWANLLRKSHTHAGFGVVGIGDRTYLVGLYQRPLAELARPLPFRPRRQAEVVRAMGGLPAALRPEITVPQGARLARGEAKVVQLAARRPADGAAFEIIGGPIFLSPPDASTAIYA